MDDERLLFVQCGNDGNFVSTHFWNMQGDFPSPLYQSKHIPRCLIMDLAHSTGNLSLVTGGLTRYDGRVVSQRENDPSLWEGQVDTVDRSLFEADSPVTQFVHGSGEEDTQLESNYWSDFLLSKCYVDGLHCLRWPSLVNRSSFLAYGDGEDIWSTVAEVEALDERLHRLLERCDTVSGTVFVCDADSAFGGAGVKWLVKLREELEKVPIVAFSVETEDDGVPSAVVAGTRAMTLSGLQEHATLVAPLRMVNDTSRYRASAALGLTIDGLLGATKWREQRDRRSLDSIVAVLHRGSHRNWLDVRLALGHEGERWCGMSGHMPRGVEGDMHGYGVAAGCSVPLVSKMRDETALCDLQTQATALPSSYPRRLEETSVAVQAEARPELAVAIRRYAEEAGVDAQEWTRRAKVTAAAKVEEDVLRSALENLLNTADALDN